MSSQNTNQSSSSLNETQVSQELEDQRIKGDEWKLDLSQEDRELANEVEDKLKEVQKQMEMIEQKTKMLQKRLNFPFGGSGSLPNMEQIVEKQKEKQQNSDQPEEMPMPPKIDYKDFPVIDSRGNLVSSREEAIERYHNSLPFIRCLELPFCYVQIKKKIQFWAVSSVGLSFLYSSFFLVRDRKPLKMIQFKPLIKNAGLIFLAGSLFSTLETIYFNDYCDINSYHYQDNNRAETIKYLKQRILASQRK
ncbi:hypothetical protein ABPG74_014692 [Tetrahymena malaccensis]